MAPLAPRQGDLMREFCAKAWSRARRAVLCAAQRVPIPKFACGAADDRPSATQRALHAGPQRAGAGKSQVASGRCADPRPGRFRRAGKQGCGARQCLRGGEGRRLRPARAGHPRQRHRDRVGHGRPARGGERRARRHPGAQGCDAGRHRHRRQGPGRHQRPGQGAAVGDDGDAELGPECARDRRAAAPTRRTASPAWSWAPTTC